MAGATTGVLELINYVLKKKTSCFHVHTNKTKILHVFMCIQKLHTQKLHSCVNKKSFKMNLKCVLVIYLCYWHKKPLMGD